MPSFHLAISLFDPQLDHIETKITNTTVAKSRSPLLGISAVARMPLVTKHIILVASENIEAAERIKPLLEKQTAKAVAKRVSEEGPREAYRQSVDIKLVSVNYSNIWDLDSCSNDIGRALAGHLNRCSGIKTVVLNLIGGTATAKTALFLSAARLLRGKAKPELRLVLAKPGHDMTSQLECIPFVPNAPRFVGLLAQGVGTKNARFISSLNRLEQVLLSSRYERILITGPTGAGKSELAKLIMAYMRALHPDITEENCIHQNIAAIAPTLMESALLGHDPGSFTGAIKGHKGIFERADNGIVFLDEIGELPKHLQAKLLTLLDGVPFFRVGGEVPISSNYLLLCGTNVDLQIACEKGDFRRDLFERLRSWHVEVPAICDRVEDIEVALQRERGEWRRKTGKEAVFDRKSGAKEFFLEKARCYSWPGNFREFHATFSHLAMFAGEDGITKADVEAEFQKIMAGAEGMTMIRSTTDDEIQNTPNEYDMADMARLACALDVCRKSKTASEAGNLLFGARLESALRNGTQFNGAASLQRLFAQFGLKISFKNGMCIIQKHNQKT